MSNEQPHCKITHSCETNLWEEDAVIGLLQNYCDVYGLSAFCREHKIDVGNVSNILSGKKRLTKQIVNAIGFDRIILYKGFKQGNEQ